MKMWMTGMAVAIGLMVWSPGVMAACGGSNGGCGAGSAQKKAQEDAKARAKAKAEKEAKEKAEREAKEQAKREAKEKARDASRLDTLLVGLKQLETFLDGDAALTGDESKQIGCALSDTNCRGFGASVSMNAEITETLAKPTLSREEARRIVKDVRHLAELRKQLLSDTLKEADRGKTQTEYDALLKKYFHAAETADTKKKTENRQ